MNRSERNKKYYEEHKEERKIYLKNYRAKNREKLLSQKRNHWNNNKNEINKKRKIWRDNNTDKISARSKVYYEKNKEKIKEYQNKYEIQRKQKDICYKLRINLRARVRGAIKNNGTKKSYSTINLIGCAIEELKQHLESQFRDGMSWDNYGEWEIDHIKPCVSFNLKDEEEQKKCFHYSNLQPLWKTENRMKGARIA